MRDVSQKSNLRSLDERKRRVLYVFFGRYSRGRRARRPLRLIRRKPHLAYLKLLEAIVVRLYRSSITHCAVGYDGAVLNPVIERNQYWPHIPFTLEYPRLTCAFELPIDGPVDLDRYPVWRNWHQRLHLLSIVKWITRGRVRSGDCVDTVIDVLRQGGITIPRHIVAPGQLHDWLLEHYATSHRPFDEPDAGDSGSTGCGAG